MKKFQGPSGLDILTAYRDSQMNIWVNPTNMFQASVKVAGVNPTNVFQALDKSNVFSRQSEKNEYHKSFRHLKTARVFYK